MRLALYTAASTANPTGRRPWNSRLSYYVPNTFALPTTGQGPFLLNPGVVGMPMQAGGVPSPMTPAIAAAPGLGFLGQPPFPGPSPTRPAVFAVPVSERTAPYFVVTAPRRTMGFYKRARFSVPTSSMSGLGQIRVGPSKAWAPVVARSARQAPPRISVGTGNAFLPIGSTGLYTSAPQLSTEAAGQGYYQVGTNAAGQPIYSTTPSAAQLAAATAGTAAAAGAAPLATAEYGQQLALMQGQPGTQGFYQQQQQLAMIQQQLQAAQAAQAASGGGGGSTATPSPTPTTTTDGTSSISDWLSTDSLGFGLNNGWYLGIGAVGVYLLTSKKGR